MKATDLMGIENPFLRQDRNLTTDQALAPGQNNRGWIESPLFDLSLFTLSPLAGLVVILPVLLSPKGLHVYIAATYLIAIPTMSRASAFIWAMRTWRTTARVGWLFLLVRC